MSTKKDFSTLSPEEIASLTGKEKAAYEKWLNDLSGSSDTSTSAPAKKKSAAVEEEADEASAFYDKAKEIARKYWKDNKDCSHDSLVIVTDGTVFYGSPKGKNAAENHIAANRNLNLSSVTIER